MNKKTIIKDLATPVETSIFYLDTVTKAVELLKKKKIGRKIIYFYVIDENNKLVGIISTRILLLAPPDHFIKDLMDPVVISLSENEPVAKAKEFFDKYHLLAIPVVDEEKKLVGVLDVETYLEDSFDVSSSLNRSEIFQMIGYSLEEGKKGSVFKNYRIRMPWIFCNLLGGILCAIVSHYNEHVLQKFLLLAMFIPLVLSLSEAISMQSMSHAIHLLRHAKGNLDSMFQIFLKEWKIVALMALSCGFIVFFISMIFGDGSLAALIIGLGIFISVMISSLFGITLPLILHRMNLDPKVAAGPLVLTLSDVLTTFL
jgi:magnesium transporter